MPHRQATFHESWHQVADLQPRLRAGIHNSIPDRRIFPVAWSLDWPGMILWIAQLGTAAYTLLNAGTMAGKLLTNSSGLLPPAQSLLMDVLDYPRRTLQPGTGV